MKKLFIATIFLSFVLTGISQVEAPDLSPRTTIQQKVGLTNFELEYARPSVREREIFGNILPYGKMWRTGANKNSMLTFDTEATFAGKKIEAGTYAIFTKIDETKWTIYLYKETENWGVPEDWNEEAVALSLEVKTNNNAKKKETFTISFDDITTTSFNLIFAWDTRRALIPVTLPTKELAKASIVKAMGGPSDRDYYVAASFYLEEGENLEEALTFIKKAIEKRGDEAFWYTRKQALIEYELGDKKAAIASAKRSLEAAKKANYDSYIKMNEESIKEWSAK